MQKLIITLILLTFQLIAFSQSAEINGYIFQTDSINSLPGANIYLEKTSLGAISNGKGYFSIKNISAGEYTLVISSIGYDKQRKQISINDGEQLTIKLFLKESVAKLEEIVIMTNGNSGIKNIPGSVHYISPKELEKNSYTDINRTLRNIPGVNLQEEDGYGLRTNIGLRGTGVERSSKITIMEDGILMAPAPYAEPAAYYFPTIGRMQGVEIMKGSSQIKYGPFTTGGAINLISTQIPDDFSGKVSLWAGSFGGRNGHVNVGNSHKNIAYMVESFQYSADGFKQLDGGGNTGFDKKDFLAKLRFNTNANAKIYQSLTLKAGNATEISNETYLGLTENDFNINPYRKYAAAQKDVMTTTQTQFSATHFVKFHKNISLTSSVYRSDFSRNWYKLDKIKDDKGKITSIASILDNPENNMYAYSLLAGANSINNDALGLKANNRKYFAKGAQTALGIQFNTGVFAHGIDIGIRYHQDQADRKQWEDFYAIKDGKMLLTKSGVIGSESNRIVQTNALASYIQYKLKYNKITFTPGLRHENIYAFQKDYGKKDADRTGIELTEANNRVNIFIPGFGLDYQINNHINTFLGIHKGFSPPGVRKETLPEESINYELGTRIIKNATSVQIVAFFNDYKNLLGSDLAAAGGLGSGDLFNAGKVLTKGLEFLAIHDLLGHLEYSKLQLPFTVSYTYTNAVFKNSFSSSFAEWGNVNSGDYFPYMAMHQLSIAIGVEHKKFNFNISNRFTDAMRTMPGKGSFSEENKIPSYMVLDASANYHVSRNISLFGSITNITNEAYLVARRPAGLRPGMPRALNLGLKANF